MLSDHPAGEFLVRKILINEHLVVVVDEPMSNPVHVLDHDDIISKHKLYDDIYL